MPKNAARKTKPNRFFFSFSLSMATSFHFFVSVSVYPQSGHEKRRTLTTLSQRYANTPNHLCRQSTPNRLIRQELGGLSLEIGVFCDRTVLADTSLFAKNLCYFRFAESFLLVSAFKIAPLSTNVNPVLHKKSNVMAHRFFSSFRYKCTTRFPAILRGGMFSCFLSKQTFRRGQFRTKFFSYSFNSTLLPNLAPGSKKNEKNFFRKKRGGTAPVFPRFVRFPPRDGFPACKNRPETV